MPNSVSPKTALGYDLRSKGTFYARRWSLSRDLQVVPHPNSGKKMRRAAAQQQQYLRVLESRQPVVVYARLLRAFRDSSLNCGSYASTNLLR